MFGRKKGGRDFDREVAVEIAYLLELHGENAVEAARERAARPRIRTQRRKIIEEAGRRIAAGKAQPARS